MNFLRKLFFGVLLTSAMTVSAQDFSSLAISEPKTKAVFAKILPDIPYFSAKTVMGMFDSKNTLLKKLPMNLTLTRDGMLDEIDVMQMPFPQPMREAMQEAHLNKINIITRTDVKKVYVVFPGIQAYEEFPIADAVLDEMTQRANTVNIQTQELGQITVDGHECTNVKLTVTETNLPPEFAMLARANDLQNFPIRLELYTKTSITRFIFENVQLKEPDASLFEVPSNYTLFTNTADIMRYAREKSQNASGNTPQ